MLDSFISRTLFHVKINSFKFEFLKYKIKDDIEKSRNTIFLSWFKL